MEKCSDHHGAHLQDMRPPVPEKSRAGSPRKATKPVQTASPYLPALREGVCESPNPLEAQKDNPRRQLRRHDKEQRAVVERSLRRSHRRSPGPTSGGRWLRSWHGVPHTATRVGSRRPRRATAARQGRHAVPATRRGRPPACRRCRAGHPSRSRRPTARGTPCGCCYRIVATKKDSGATNRLQRASRATPHNTSGAARVGRQSRPARQGRLGHSLASKNRSRTRQGRSGTRQGRSQTRQGQRRTSNCGESPPGPEKSGSSRREAAARCGTREPKRVATGETGGSAIGPPGPVGTTREPCCKQQKQEARQGQEEVGTHSRKAEKEPDAPSTTFWVAQNFDLESW